MSAGFPLTRRMFIAGTAGAVCACAAPPLPLASRVPAPMPINPLIRQRADAQISRHSDGFYYMTGSVPEYDRLVMRRAPTLAGLADSEEIVIWRRPLSGKMGGHIWAPELHYLDGRWHVYFAAGDFDDRFRIRTYVLRSTTENAFDGGWELLGKLETPWDTFTLDSTVFEHKGTRYLFWAQHEPGIRTNSNLYVAPLATPTTIARPPTRLTIPTLPWEVQGFKVAEGPALLRRNGRLFLTYSGSATDARYAMGLLTADEDADVMSPESWTKSPEPVFVSSPVTKVYGPGHNSFTIDEEGRDLLVFHGRDYEEIEGDPLYDPNRHTRIQRIYYHADGTPDFGVPVGNGPLPERFAPLDRPGHFLRAAEGRLTVGPGDLPSSQLRRLPGLVGGESLSLEPILMPGQLVILRDDGSLDLAASDGRPDFARRASFLMVPGLADPHGVSFQQPGSASTYLSAGSAAVTMAEVRGEASKRAATFLVS